jgi:hypothetical protein
VTSGIGRGMTGSAGGRDPRVSRCPVGSHHYHRKKRPRRLWPGRLDQQDTEAFENADAIAAVDGIDVLHIGASDLSTEMGIPAVHARADACRLRDRRPSGEGSRQGDGGRRRAPGFRVPELAVAARRVT